jgi:hypothetical protein
MAESVASRGWRQKLREVRHEHTTEVRAETLPPEVADLITEMASQMARINLELIDAKQRLAAIESIEIDKRLLKGAA